MINQYQIIVISVLNYNVPKYVYPIISIFTKKLASLMKLNPIIKEQLVSK